MAELARADTIRQIMRLTSGHNLRRKPGYLRNQVCEVKRVGIVVINQQNHRKGMLPPQNTKPRTAPEASCSVVLPGVRNPC